MKNWTISGFRFSCLSVTEAETKPTSVSPVLDSRITEPLCTPSDPFHPRFELIPAETLSVAVIWIRGKRIPEPRHWVLALTMEVKRKRIIKHFCVARTMLCELSILISIPTLWNVLHYHHFADEETGAQIDKMIASCLDINPRVVWSYYSVLPLLFCVLEPVLLVSLSRDFSLKKWDMKKLFLWSHLFLIFWILNAFKWV